MIGLALAATLGVVSLASDPVPGAVTCALSINGRPAIRAPITPEGCRVSQETADVGENQLELWVEAPSAAPSEKVRASVCVARINQYARYYAVCPLLKGK
jgi:hypothetical protein